MNCPTYAVPREATPSATIRDSGKRWPVRRVFCVGRNYADHALEMGADPSREAPFFFTKPADAVVPASGTISYPPLTDDLQYEIELVVAIGRETTNASTAQAAESIFGYSAGVDLTRRDLQNEAKTLRRPWDWGKAFDESAPIAPIIERHEILNAGRIWLKVNGELRQDADLENMIWSVPEIIAVASQSVTLRPGDLIFTGTPAGVGAISPSDLITGGVESVGDFSFTIGTRDATFKPH